MKFLDYHQHHLHDLHPDMATPTSWSSSVGILIAKIRDATLVKDFRPITLQNVCARLYDRLLLSRLTEFCGHFRTAQFGNRRSYQGVELIHTIRRTQEKLRLQNTKKLKIWKL